MHAGIKPPIRSPALRRKRRNEKMASYDCKKCGKPIEILELGADNQEIYLAIWDSLPIRQIGEEVELMPPTAVFCKRHLQKVRDMFMDYIKQKPRPAEEKGEEK
jgi:hypothetical protein